MKKMSVAVTGLCLLAPLAFASKHQSMEHRSVANEFIVKIKAGMEKSILSSLKSEKIKSKLDLLSGKYLLLQDISASEMMNIKNLNGIEYIEPNYILSAIRTEETLESILAGTITENMSDSSRNDPQYGKLWGLKNTGANEPNREGNYSGEQGVLGADVNALKAWDLTMGSDDVTIAVIDTGIDYNHPDLKNNIWVNPKEIAGNGKDDDRNGVIDDVHGYHAIENSGDPMDGNGHGTHCAGTIGAQHNNSLGVTGVMNQVKMMAVKFLSDEGSGTLADAVKAIDYATKMNVDLMSNSWGGGGFSQTLYDSIDAAKKRGILFVAAAGNSATNNDTRPHYPSSYEVDNVISVAAHTHKDELASFSCFGKKSVHIAAPGHNILSTTPNNSYKVYSGTSMATPHVSGVLGLLLAQEGRMDVSEVRERLMATSVPQRSYKRKVMSGGRIDAYNLLTDTRIPRNEPDWSGSRSERLREVFESEHPYANNLKVSKTYNFPGAKFIKVIVEKYDLEMNYDFLTVKDAQGTVIEKITNSGSNYETDYVEGDSLVLEMTSDSSQSKWGVRVAEVKVIY